MGEFSEVAIFGLLLQIYALAAAADECIIEGEVRLAGADNNSTTEGRVEICLNGVWGTVCDNGWDKSDAEVVCRQLNLTTDYAVTTSNFRGGSGPIHYAHVSCNGNETRLLNCTVNVTVNVTICDHEGVGVRCPTEPECNETDIQLVSGDYWQSGDIGLTGRDSNFGTEGRVEICLNGVWHTICDYDWDTLAAKVVCRQLNLTTDYAVALKQYGGGSGPIYYAYSSCTGSETHLSNCTVFYTDDGARDLCSHNTDAGVRCLSEPECNETDIRLVSDDYGQSGDIGLTGRDSGSITEGRVEICLNGVWGTVCNYSWGILDAKVVCRQLNLTTKYARALEQYGGGSGPTHYAFFSCTGSEIRLADCTVLFTGDIASSFCYRFADAGVRCPSEPECNETDIRLVSGDYGQSGDTEIASGGGNFVPEGRLEICLSGAWGTVCDEGWDRIDATVVCRQLNLTADYSRALFQSGGGSVPIHYFYFFCQGRETRLADCIAFFTGDTASDLCSHRKFAGVRCPHEPECNETDIRLVDGQASDDGRVEVCLRGQWGSVCDDSWDFRDAEVVCRQLGYDGISYPLRSNGGDNPLNFNLDEIHCTGNESRLSECSHRGIGVHDCSEGEDEAGVACSRTDIEIPNNSEPEITTTAPTITSVTAPTVTSVTVPTVTSVTVPTVTSVTAPTVTSVTVVSMSSITVPNVLSKPDSAPSGGAIAGIVVGILGFIIAAAAVPVVVVLVVMYKRVHRRKQLERMQMDILAVTSHGRPVGSHAESHIYEMTTINSKESELKDKANTELGSSPHVHETRIRVSSHYLRELTLGKFVIKHEDITLLDNIGEGEFGIVYKARLNSRGRRSKEVAIKTLKGDFDQMDVDKFVEESLKMSRFKHSHVMGLIGVCLDAGSAPFIIMPYMANGSLLKYLKRERMNIVLYNSEDEDEVKAVCKRLTVMCSQIVSGMEYLAAEKYIHRDLAARNCMIDTHFLIKITDFGLAEDVFVRDYFRQGSAEDVVKLPVKWMAPESLIDGHFSEKSDVWSYGVTMWEIFSGGKAPYPGTNPLALIQQLEEGEMMPKPYNTACSDEMYAMMRHCWERAPEDRPTFKELHRNLTKYIEHIAGYLEMGFNPFSGEEGSKSEEADETMEGVEVKTLS